MVSMRSHLALRIFSAAFAVCAVFSPAAAQEDPDPNSPTPALLRFNDSNRVVAVTVTISGRVDPSRAQVRAFSPNSLVAFFVTNISLMQGEGANAFRIYAEDSRGRLYRFPVEGLSPVKGNPSLYAVTVRLTDEIGYWEPPTPDGDILIRISWRGLTSEKLLLGYGKTGGKIRVKFDSNQQQQFASGGFTDTSGPPTSEYVGYRWSGDRMRFLEQAGFGPTPALDARIRRIGIRTYLAEQFEAPYPSSSNSYPDFPLKSTDANAAIPGGCGPAPNPTTLEYRICIRDHYSMYPVQKWLFLEALYGGPQLRHRVAWALSQIWVISGVDTQQSRWMTEYHKILSANAFGNYRTLMKQMTLNPGMGNYLDMARSTKNNPNENYARELKQLFTIGLFMLNQDGTLQLDGQGEPIPTYSQDTVNAFTKVLTGFQFCETTGPSCPNRTLGAPNYIDPLLLNQNQHDLNAKVLLSYPNAVNQNIAANLNGNTEIDLALDNIFYHPNVGPFVSKILIQHMVTSDPTPAYVGRVTAAFNNNGLGVRGDMKAVIRAILLDPEARGDVKTDPNFGKLREPVQFVTNFLKTFNVRSADGQMQSDGVLTGLTNPLSQNPFNSPTVFNYYSPDYVIPGTSLLGPEFGIMTTGTSIARANMANTMTFNRINVSENAPLGTSIDLTEMQALATADTTGNQLMDALNQKMMHGTMSAEMRNRILTAVLAVSSTDPTRRAQQAVYLVTTSSQYQVQR